MSLANGGAASLTIRDAVKPDREISQLIEIMAALRHRERGCPWDLEQTFETIAPYTIEEAYEVADAIQRGDLADLKDELGDLLLQVVFHARLAEECAAFDFGDVVEAVTKKLIRRHPHVFGDRRSMSPEAVKSLWENIKAAERAERPPGPQEASASLAGIPQALPALTRATKLQAKAAAVGFDWQNARLVLAKIHEEIREVEALIEGEDRQGVAEEIGDLLFAVVNLARHVRIDPEAALRRANDKFVGRFGFIERALAERGKTPQQSSLAEMDELWNEAKRSERKAS